jgi:hypothetical protein
VSTVDMEWLKSLYAGRNEVSETEIRDGLAQRPESNTRNVTIIRSA